MYSGYYCKKCKIIPLIKIILDNNKKIKILSKCKCFSNFLSKDQVNKYYYSENIEQKNILNDIKMTKIQKDESLSIKVNEIIDKIKEKNEVLLIIKKEIINFFNSKFKEVEKLFENALKINEDYEKITKILVNSYKYMPSNNSNIFNIQKIIENDDQNKAIFQDERMTLLQFTKIIKKVKEGNNNKLNENLEKINNHLNLFIDSVKKNIDEYLCINSNNIKYKISRFNTSYHTPICQVLKISDNLLLIRKEKKFDLYSIKNNKFFRSYYSSFIKSITKVDLDKQNIICLSPKFIKILSFNKNYDVEDIDDNDDLGNIDDDDDNDSSISLFNKKNIEIKINEKYNNILSFNDNNDNMFEGKFILSNKNGIYFYKYDLRKKLIENYHSYNCTCIKLELIKYNKEKVLLVVTPFNIFLYNIHSLEIIEEYKCKIICISIDENKVSIKQINNNEIIITNNEYIYIFKLKAINIKLAIRNRKNIYHSFFINDGSMAFCDDDGIIVYSLRTFESIFKLDINIIKEIYSNSKKEGNISVIINSIYLSNNKILIKFLEGKYELLELDI